mmetsp:Transcript_5878/g.9122  ORF Transcript_5878/g.9122 Transcript_5878/m.9122 type:complete len:363 (-) Transcript_5878:211-1299(-)
MLLVIHFFIGRYLDLNGNSISTLHPHTFTGLASLRHLMLASNKIRHISSHMFQHLHKLEILLLQDNPIESIDADAFKYLTNLKILDLGSTSLKSLHPDTFHHLGQLQHLAIDKSQLKELPRGIFRNLSSLEYLYIDNLDLKSLPQDIFHDLKSLRSLHMHTNNITRLPVNLFKNTERLERVYMFASPSMGFDMKTYWGGRKKELINMGVRYFNGTYPGIPKGFFDVMPEMMRFQCKFWTVDDGTPRTWDYIDKIIREKKKDQSPFQHQFADTEEEDRSDNNDDAANIVSKTYLRELEKKSTEDSERIAELESKLLASVEKNKELFQDISKVRLQMKKVGITFHRNGTLSFPSDHRNLSKPST